MPARKQYPHRLPEIRVDDKTLAALAWIHQLPVDLGSDAQIIRNAIIIYAQVLGWDEDGELAKWEPPQPGKEYPESARYRKHPKLGLQVRID